MSKYAAVNVKFGADISQFSTAMQNAAREMKKAGDQLQNVGKSMTMNLTAPIVALGAAALYSFGQIDSLKRGLISFSGSAQLAEEEFNKLREVAKLPGVGLEEAVRGSINLQAIGMSADKAREAMTAFGNAIATIGGGKENFDLAIRGFGQLMNASKPLQQDLYQIANQLPQINKLMIEAFGTNRAEDLAKMGISGKQLADFLVTKLGELPKVSGGIKNAFENMSDSVKISLASFGESLNKAFDIEGKINSLSGWLGSLAEGFKVNP
jgi:tape measure domain-containing protein